MSKGQNDNEEEKLGKLYDYRLFKRLLYYAKPYWALFLISFLLLGGATVSDLARPYLTKIAIDDYLNGYKLPMIANTANSNVEGKEIIFEGRSYKRIKEVPEGTIQDNIYSLFYQEGKGYLVNGYIDLKDALEPKITTDAKGSLMLSAGNVKLSARELSKGELDVFRQNDYDAIALIGFIFIGVIVLGFLFVYLQIRILSYVGQNIIFNIRQEVFGHIQKMSLAFFDKNPVGRLVTRVINDTETLNDMYTNVLTTLLKDFLLLLGVVIIMFRMDVKISLVGLAVLPLLLIATTVFRIKIRNVYRNVRTTLAKVNSVFAENISGIRIIQIFSREKKKQKEFEEINNSYLKAGLNEIVVFGVFRPLVEFISTMAVSLVIWYGGGKVIGGSLEFGMLFAFVSYTEQFFRPINDLSEKYNILQSAMASSERIFMILDTPYEENVGSLTLNDSGLNGDIEFKNVWFAYNDEEWVLRDVSFKVPKGKTLAIVGATGSGKTTIISLLSRFYEIQKGQILVDGIDIKDMKKDDLRKSIAAVLQDVFLFSGSIKSNIRLNNNSISDDDIKRVSRYVNAGNFIEKLPSGYDEEVMERGASFSAGQRQLLAFARALAFNPSILILDEATANIDTETELLIQDALRKITQDRTTIVIAHRLSTIQHADNIIVLHKGKIRESGTHQELLKNKGLYYNLYNLQYS